MKICSNDLINNDLDFTPTLETQQNSGAGSKAILTKRHINVVIINMETLK